jgi:hypothetical protein
MLEYVLPAWGERNFKDINRDVSKLLDSIEDSVARAPSATTKKSGTASSPSDTQFMLTS